MKYNKRVVYKSVYKCDICGKQYIRPIGFIKLRGLELKYEQKIARHQYGWMFAINPLLTRTVRKKLDVCDSCASKINTYINGLQRTKGEIKDDTLYV